MLKLTDYLLLTLFVVDLSIIIEDSLLSGNLSCSQTSLISEVIPLVVLDSGRVDAVWYSLTGDDEDGCCTWGNCLFTSAN